MLIRQWGLVVTIYAPPSGPGIRRRGRWVGWFVLGAIVPDLPYVAMFAAATLRTGPGVLADLALWDSVWRNPLVCASIPSYPGAS
jgi:hypothetical protein